VREIGEERHSPSGHLGTCSRVPARPPPRSVTRPQRGPVDVQRRARGVCLRVNELEPQRRSEILEQGKPCPSATGCRMRRYSSTSPSLLSDWANVAPPQASMFFPGSRLSVPISSASSPRAIRESAHSARSSVRENTTRAKKTAETVDAGGGTRTPDTRIMMRPGSQLWPHIARFRGVGRGQNRVRRARRPLRVWTHPRSRLWSSWRGAIAADSGR
jgi:hypothetical protein